MYYRYGREKQFTVPRYLSFVPDPGKKPWVVNLLFKGDAMTFDQDGYYATLLDLHRRKFIMITDKEQGGGVQIQVLRETSDDPYEQRVITFLKDVGEGGVMDTSDLQQLAESAKTDTGARSRILRYQRELSSVTRRVDPRLINSYIVDGRDHVLPIALVGAALTAVCVMFAIISPVLVGLIAPAAILWGMVIIQSLVAMAAFPSTLFGHWKDDKYKEKLEWDAFAKFLSDLALIRQYAPEDLSMWGEWLVYGTALGIGDKVEKAMKDLRINIPETGMPVGAYTGIHAGFLPILFFTPPSQGGSGWRFWRRRGFRWRRRLRWRGSGGPLNQIRPSSSCPDESLIELLYRVARRIEREDVCSILKDEWAGYLS